MAVKGIDNDCVATVGIKSRFKRAKMAPILSVDDRRDDGRDDRRDDGRDDRRDDRRDDDCLFSIYILCRSLFIFFTN